MDQKTRELIRQLQVAEREYAQPPRPRDRGGEAGMHYSLLPEDTSGTTTALDWNAYRQAVGPLLAAGHEGHWVLIRRGVIVGTWESEEEAVQSRSRDHLTEPVLLKQIRTWEPLLRIREDVRLWRG